MMTLTQEELDLQELHKSLMLRFINEVLRLESNDNTAETTMHPHIDSLHDLSDGRHLATLLRKIDPKYFSKLRILQTSDNWILKHNNLKKVFKCLSGYISEILGQQMPSIFASLDLTAMARDADLRASLLMFQLILLIAVQSEQNETFVHMIRQMDPVAQKELMMLIEQTIAIFEKSSGKSTLVSPMKPVKGSPHHSPRSHSHSNDVSTDADFDSLKALYQEAMKKISTLEAKLNSSQSSKSHDGASELDHIKAELYKLEHEKHELQVLNEQKSQQIQKLSQMMERVNLSVQESSGLRDQLDEMKAVKDQLAKTELMAEKYRKRAEESVSLKKTVQTFECELEAAQTKCLALEDEVARLKSFKTLVDTYKSKVGAMEEKLSQMQLEHSTLKFKLGDMTDRLQKVEIGKKGLADVNVVLHDRIKDLEHQLLMKDEIHEGMESGSQQPQRSLEAESANQQHEIDLKNLKSVLQEKEERIFVLENLIEDAEKMNTKLKEEVRLVYEKNLKLENEKSELEVVAKDSRMLADVTVKVKELEEQLSTEKSKTKELEAIQSRFESLSDEHRSNLAHLNRTLHERDELAAEIDQLREKIASHETNISELRATLASSEVETKSRDEATEKLASATHKLIQLTEQNTVLHQALKRAKDHILHQETTIKNLKSSESNKETYSEALESYKVMLSQKEAELNSALEELKSTRDSAKQEHRLIMSAWYELTLQMRQANKSAPSSSGNMPGSTASDGIENSPKSWLKQQRLEIQRKR